MTTGSFAVYERKQKYGRIVNVTSVTGPLVSNSGSGAYGGGQRRDGRVLMRAVAIEHGLDGITINGVWRPAGFRPGLRCRKSWWRPNTRRSGGAGAGRKRVAAAVAFSRFKSRVIHHRGKILVVDGGKHSAGNETSLNTRRKCRFGH